VSTDGGWTRAFRVAISSPAGQPEKSHQRPSMSPSGGDGAPGAASIHAGRAGQVEAGTRVDPASATVFFKIPTNRVVELGTRIEL